MVTFGSRYFEIMLISADVMESGIIMTLLAGSNRSVPPIRAGQIGSWRALLGKESNGCFRIHSASRRWSADGNVSKGIRPQCSKNVFKERLLSLSHSGK